MFLENTAQLHKDLPHFFIRGSSESAPTQILDRSFG